MALKMKELVAKLQEKDQETDVEFVVCKTDGEIVAMHMQRNAGDLVRALRLFEGNRK